MMGYDIFFDKNLSTEALLSVLSVVLDISKSNIYMVEGFIGDYFDKDENFLLDYNENDARHLCQRFSRQGDFKTKIELGMVGRNNWPDELELSKKLSKKLCCKTLISSDEINPYHWILVDESGNHKFVFVDQKRLDDHNEFVISSNA